MEDVKNQLQALITEPEADITWLKSDQIALFRLQKDYIITYVDKQQISSPLYARNISLKI